MFLATGGTSGLKQNRFRSIFLDPPGLNHGADLVRFRVQGGVAAALRGVGDLSGTANQSGLAIALLSQRRGSARRAAIGSRRLLFGCRCFTSQAMAPEDFYDGIDDPLRLLAAELGQALPRDIKRILDRPFVLGAGVRVHAEDDRLLAIAEDFDAVRDTVLIDPFASLHL